MFRSLVLLVGMALAFASPSQAQVTPRPEVLSGAFRPGFVGESEGELYPIRVVRIGEMNISSGRVVLADPLVLSAGEKPLALSVPPGRYPVDLAVADAKKSGQRVALARLLLSRAPATRWSLAVTDEQDVRTLEGDEIFGYGVDAGTGAFIDASAAAWLGAAYGQPDEETIEKLQDGWFTRGSAAAEKLGIPYGFTLIERMGEGDAAMFSSGWGDGFYASWIGYGADGLPVAIVTDFAVITAVNMPEGASGR